MIHARLGKLGLGYTPVIGSTVYDPLSNQTIFNWGTPNAYSVPGDQTSTASTVPASAPTGASYVVTPGPGCTIIGGGVYCPPVTTLPVGGPIAPSAAAAAPAPSTTFATLVPAPSPSLNVPAPTTSAPPQGPPVTVNTPGGGTATVPASEAPTGTDASLSPVSIHVPNIWDSLDPSKVSQFQYRGQALSMPVWMSRQYLDQITPPSSPGGDAAAVAMITAVRSVPWWIWVVIAALFLLGGGMFKKTRAHRVAHPRRRKVAA